MKINLSYGHLLIAAAAIAALTTYILSVIDMPAYLSAFATTLLLLCYSTNAVFHRIIRPANASSTLAIDAIVIFFGFKELCLTPATGIGAYISAMAVGCAVADMLLYLFQEDLSLQHCRYTRPALLKAQMLLCCGMIFCYIPTKYDWTPEAVGAAIFALFCLTTIVASIRIAINAEYIVEPYHPELRIGTGPAAVIIAFMAYELAAKPLSLATVIADILLIGILAIDIMRNRETKHN